MKSSAKDGELSVEEALSAICTDGVSVEPPPIWETSCGVSEPFATDAPKQSPDEALKIAIAAALEVGDYHRAETLIAVLKSTPRPMPANVIELSSRRVGDL